MKKIFVIAMLMFAPIAIYSTPDREAALQANIAKKRTELTEATRNRDTLKEQYENQYWIQKKLPGGVNWQYPQAEEEVRDLEKNVRLLENQLRQLQARK